MTIWTDATRKDIQAHNKDFTVTTCAAVIRKAGGFGAYVRSVGSFFATVYPRFGTECETVKDYQDRAACLTGIMAFYGFDYSNSNDGSGHYYRWGCGSGTAAAADAFRKTGRGKCAGGDIEKVCDPSVVTTNCNYGVNTFLKALGLYKCASENARRWATVYGKPVTDKRDLQPGDFVHFFQRPVSRKNPSSWAAGGWVHVAMVYKVEGRKIWLVDFGSRFIKSKEPLHYMTIDGSDKGGGEYAARYWTGIHAFDLKEEKKEKGKKEKAVEMKREVDCFLQAKEKEYGKEISEIRERYAKDETEYLRAAADYVLNGYAGSGEARKVFFGDDYTAVQEKVNWIIRTAEDVIIGKYGSGDVRKAALGDDYDVVQAQVNRILRR